VAVGVVAATKSSAAHNPIFTPGPHPHVGIALGCVQEGVGLVGDHCIDELYGGMWTIQADIVINRHLDNSPQNERSIIGYRCAS